jgi:FAD/FMN-containing dehydrogenase
MLDSQDLLTDKVMPRIKQILPGGGHAYMNEGDFQDPDWKRVFYGDNYAKLERIKDKYDPKHLFYARTAVGSDKWVPQSDARLCKA